MVAIVVEPSLEGRASVIPYQGGRASAASSLDDRGPVS